MPMLNTGADQGLKRCKVLSQADSYNDPCKSLGVGISKQVMSHLDTWIESDGASLGSNGHGKGQLAF